MMFLYSSQSLIITYTKNASGGYNYKPNSVVLMTEFAKFVIATTFLSLEHARGNSPQVTMSKQSLKYAIPALLYAAHNNMVFLGLEALDAPTYQLLNNIKIVVAGVLYRIFLRKPLTVMQWLGIILLTVGQAVATLDTSGKASEAASKSLMAGVVIMCVLSCLSAGAGIYNEFLLKGSTDSTHFQNMQLYFFGVIFCFMQHIRTGMQSLETDQTGFFHGFDGSTWCVITISALMGQAVSFVLKYTDTITNRFATAASLIVTSIASSVLFSTTISLPFSIGVLVIGTAFALYYVPIETMGKLDYEVVQGSSVAKTDTEPKPVR